MSTRSAGGYRHPRPSIELGRSASGGPVHLGASYELCRRIHAAHGRTYYWATRFLPRDRRRHVHALYAFARYADDLVDHFDLDWEPARRRKALEEWSETFLASLDAGAVPPGQEPVLRAVLHTVTALGVRHDDLRAFLRSMAMDLELARYATYDDLAEYVHGSAAVIGSMMLPVLGMDERPASLRADARTGGWGQQGMDERPASLRADARTGGRGQHSPVHPDARERAMDLGIAFQLTNFLRDVAEDWDRGRLYLPLEDLDRFGVTEEDFHARHVGPNLRRLLAFEATRARALYRRAEAGWGMLAPASQPCIRIAHRLYAGILDRLEAEDWQVFRVRASVPPWRKVAVSVRELVAPTRPAALE